MRKIVLIISIALLQIASTSVAFAEKTGIYLTPKFMYSAVNGAAKSNLLPSGDSALLDFAANTFGGALSVGYDTQAGIRAELEYSIGSSINVETMSNNSISANMTNMTQTVFANIFYDFKNDSRFTPYLGGGVGVGFNTAEVVLQEIGGTSFDTLTKHTSIGLAWNVSLGLAYKISDLLALDLSYRFAQVGDAKSYESKTSENYIGTDSINNHQVLLGLRFSF